MYPFTRTITQWLKDGKYKPGDKLPGENILAEQFKVSRRDAASGDASASGGRADQQPSGKR